MNCCRSIDAYTTESEKMQTDRPRSKTLSLMNV